MQVLANFDLAGTKPSPGGKVARPRFSEEKAGRMRGGVQFDTE